MSVLRFPYLFGRKFGQMTFMNEMKVFVVDFLAEILRKLKKKKKKKNFFTSKFIIFVHFFNIKENETFSCTIKYLKIF